MSLSFAILVPAPASADPPGMKRGCHGTAEKRSAFRPLRHWQGGPAECAFAIPPFCFYAVLFFFAAPHLPAAVTNADGFMVGDSIGAFWRTGNADHHRYEVRPFEQVFVVILSCLDILHCGRILRAGHVKAGKNG
jgi:hypothetical protein